MLERHVLKMAIPAFVGIFCLSFETEAQQPEAALVLSIHGKPIMRDAQGVVTYVKPLKDVSAGVSIVLEDVDALRLCFEHKGIAYKIEGAGTVQVNDNGVQAVKGKPHVTEFGACNRSASINTTGGVLFRSLSDEKSH